MLAAEQKIAAIKLYRQQSGAGLKEAKDAVEAFAAQRGIALLPGVGCFGVFVAFVAALPLAVGLLSISVGWW